MSTADMTVIDVQNMPAEYVQAMSKTRAYIANITELEYDLARDYGNYHIAPKPADAPFSLTEITPRKGRMDFGDNKRIEFPIMPTEIAKDLCREINDGAGARSFLGVFMCGASGPTTAELADARTRMQKFYGWCVNEGDKLWQQFRNVVMIPDLYKRAANHLHLIREWATDVQPAYECQACGTPHKPGIAICPQCGFLIDRAKAMKLFPDRFAPAVPPAMEAEAPATAKRARGKAPETTES